MTLRNLALVFGHAAVGLLVVGLMYRQLTQRAGEVARVRSETEAGRRETERMQREHDGLARMRRGLEQGDPYAVEMLARERLRFTRPGELTPPALPPHDETARAPR